MVVIAIKVVTLFMYWCDTGNLRGIGKMPHLKNKLISFTKGILIVLSNTFNTFVGMLVDPIALFLFFNFLLNFIWKCRSKKKI